jgi:long-chain acyl-CoA synthetase
MRSVDELTAAELLDGLPSRVHEVYAPFVRDIPDHPAFVEGGRSWSYRQFSDAVDAAAKDLIVLGVRSGDRVIIASENSVAWERCFLRRASSMPGVFRSILAYRPGRST